METERRVPPSPGTPLHPVSPERANRQIPPQSPSFLTDHPSLLQHDPFMSPGSRSSDVQGKVIAFNTLSNGSPHKRKDSEAALRRAVVGREEAEDETKRLKEENLALKRQVEEGQGRGRKMAQRIESLMEEMQRLKETSVHSQSIYEKEIRRARKETFKSASTLVNLQEELKTTRNRFTLMREEVEVQKRKVEVREKDAFSAQYKLVGLQEDVHHLAQQVKLIEEERDALRTNLKEEEIARIAAEGRIPLPTSGPADEFSSPRKSSPRALRESNKENADPSLLDLMDEEMPISVELEYVKRQRKDAYELVNFMKLECQLLNCSCRRAEREGRVYIFDDQFDNIVAKMEARLRARRIPGPETPKTPVAPEESVLVHPKEPEPLIEFSPSTGTFKVVDSPLRKAPTLSTPSLLQSPAASSALAPPLVPMMISESPSILSLASNEGRPSDDCRILPAPTEARPIPSNVAVETSVPRTPRSLPTIPPFQSKPIRSICTTPQENPAATTTTTTMTVTTTVPLADSGYSTAKYPYSPGASKTREEALQSIERWRRGRARSVTANAATPRRKAPEGMGKRDVSAPAGK